MIGKRETVTEDQDQTAFFGADELWEKVAPCECSRQGHSYERNRHEDDGHAHGRAFCHGRIGHLLRHLLNLRPCLVDEQRVCEYEQRERHKRVEVSVYLKHSTTRVNGLNASIYPSFVSGYLLPCGKHGAVQ